MKISPCIDTVYKGVPQARALEELSALGYQYFEFWHLGDHDLDEMKRLMEKYALTLVNFDADEVPLSAPEERENFIQAMDRAFRAAELLGASHITVLSGNDTGAPRQLQHDSLVAGLKAVAPEAERLGVTVVLEASNRRVNRPNNYLTSADEAFQIIDEVGSPRVKMLYDVYHQQISEGDLLSRILPNLQKIGHFHAAGVPDRHELDACEINYDYVLRRIAQAGYDQWIGLEYFPARSSADGLKILKQYFDL